MSGRFDKRERDLDAKQSRLKEMQNELAELKKMNTKTFMIRMAGICICISGLVSVMVFNLPENISIVTTIIGTGVMAYGWILTYQMHRKFSSLSKELRDM